MPGDLHPPLSTLTFLQGCLVGTLAKPKTLPGHTPHPLAGPFVTCPGPAWCVGRPLVVSARAALHKSLWRAAGCIPSRANSPPWHKWVKSRPQAKAWAVREVKCKQAEKPKGAGQHDTGREKSNGMAWREAFPTPAHKKEIPFRLQWLSLCLMPLPRPPFQCRALASQEGCCFLSRAGPEQVSLELCPCRWGVFFLGRGSGRPPAIHSYARPHQRSHMRIGLQSAHIGLSRLQT